MVCFFPGGAGCWFFPWEIWDTTPTPRHESLHIPIPALLIPMSPFPDPSATSGEEWLHWGVAAGAPPLPQGSWGTQRWKRGLRVVPTHLDVVGQLQGAVLSLVSQVDAVQVLWEWQDQHPQVLEHTWKNPMWEHSKPPNFEGLGRFLNGSNNSA